MSTCRGGCPARRRGATTRSFITDWSRRWKRSSTRDSTIFGATRSAAAFASAGLGFSTLSFGAAVVGESRKVEIAQKPQTGLEALKAQHRSLDERIRALSAEHGPDQLEIARLKRDKLRLKDQIQRIAAENIPDIIA